MYDQNRFFDTFDDYLIAWAGQLSPRELGDYLHESGSKADNEPQSNFAEDLGRAYDHDLIYAQAADEPTTLAELAALNYITDETLINELTEYGGSQNYTCFIILWNAKRVDPITRKFASGRLSYLGNWFHTAIYHG